MEGYESNPDQRQLTPLETSQLMSPLNFAMSGLMGVMVLVK